MGRWRKEPRDQERGLWAPFTFLDLSFPNCGRKSPWDWCLRDQAHSAPGTSPFKIPLFLPTTQGSSWLQLPSSPPPPPPHDSPWYSRPRRGLAGLRERVGPGESGSRILQLASVQEGPLTSARLSFLGPTSLSESFFLFLFICLAVCLSLSVPLPRLPVGLFRSVFLMLARAVSGSLWISGAVSSRNLLSF